MQSIPLGNLQSQEELENKETKPTGNIRSSQLPRRVSQYVNLSQQEHPDLKLIEVVRDVSPIQ